MSEAGTAPNQEQVQPDPQALAALQAKIARVQKILGFLACGQLVVGVILLFAPYLLLPLGLTEVGPAEPFPYQALGVFLIALAYAADFSRKDLTFARLAFRVTALAQLGLLVVTLISMFAYPLPSSFWILVILALIFGGLPAYVIYQFKKSAG